MPERDQKPKEGGFLTDFLTAFLITAVVGVLGFSGILAYSSMSYRNQIAQAQVQSTVSTPTLSGYAYSGPTGSHRPENWPEPAAQAANYYIDRKNAPSIPSEETPEETEAEQPVEAPEGPAAPTETPVLPDSEPVAPVEENNSTNSSAKKNSSSAASENWGEISTTNEITGSLDQDAYWVKTGKSYHFSSTCPSLSRSKNIQEGTLQDALDAGKTDPCNNCANGN